LSTLPSKKPGDKNVVDSKVLALRLERKIKQKTTGFAIETYNGEIVNSFYIRDIGHQTTWERGNISLAMWVLLLFKISPTILTSLLYACNM